MPIPQPIPQPLCPRCWSELDIALGRQIHACAVVKVAKRESVIPCATYIRTQSRVQAALERGDFGRGAAARDLAWRSFSSAQAFLHGGRDEVEAPWTTLGRPPAEAGAARFGLGFDAASRV